MGDSGAGYWGRKRLARRRVLGAGAIGVVGLGIGACTSTTEAPTPAATSAAPAGSPTPRAGGAAPPAASRPTPKYGGTIKTGTSSAERSLDPLAANGGLGSHGTANCYNQLVCYKWGPEVKAPSYIVIGDLAESWTQPDDLTYIFKLRQGVKFHNLPPVNGRELVADDIIYSYQRTIELKVNAALQAGITKYEAPDKYTLKLTLDKPNADLLTSLADYTQKIVAKEAVAVNGNLDNGPTIGTGPWIFESFAPTQVFKAKRNPDYFQKGLPYAEALESNRFADVSVIVNGFRSGNLDCVGNGLTADVGQDLAKAVPGAHVSWIPLDRSQDEMALNANVAVFKNIKVRQAVAKAIDRDQMVASLALGQAVQTSGVAVLGPEWDIPEAELKRLRARDVNGAKQLLKEAGQENGFDMKIICPTYLANAYVTESEFVQANLRDVGIRATIEPLDPVTFAERKLRGQFDAYVGNNGALSPITADLRKRYYTGGSINSYGYDDPEMNRLIDQQAVQRDVDARKKMLLDIERKVVNDAIVLSLMIRQTPHISQPEVMDWLPNMDMFVGQYHWTTVWFNK
jgi:peptide/nickel transport system substrate-binding protein